MSHPVLEPGNVAVVTGGASGIGRGVAKALVARGLRVAIADVDEAKLEATRAELAAEAVDGEAAVLARRVDVSQLPELETLRDATREAFGRVDFLMNNAAAFRIAGTSGDPQAWRETFETNVLGITNGIHVFLPGMLEQGTPGLIVNTGSKQGITNPPGIACYNAAKAAVKSLTESLAHELRNTEGCQIEAHLLVPGWTTTGDREHQPGAWRPEQVAEALLEAIERHEFYVICPDGETTWEMDRKRILWSAMDLTERRPPLSRWHPEWKEAFEGFEP